MYERKTEGPGKATFDSKGSPAPRPAASGSWLQAGSSVSSSSTPPTNVMTRITEILTFSGQPEMTHHFSADISA